MATLAPGPGPIHISNSPLCMDTAPQPRRPSARVLLSSSRPLPSEGAGNAGRTMRPQPCVRVEKAHKRSHHGHTGNTRHSPRNGFNGFLRALLGDRALLPPSYLRSLLLRNLMPASGHQDHTTSPSASKAPSSEATPVSIASRPTSVTTRTPLLSRRDAAKPAADLGVTAMPANCDRLARRAICAWQACNYCPLSEVRDTSPQHRFADFGKSSALVNP
jgi:hypothetical protein